MSGSSFSVCFSNGIEAMQWAPLYSFDVYSQLIEVDRGPNLGRRVIPVPPAGEKFLKTFRPITRLDLDQPVYNLSIDCSPVSDL